MMPRGTAKVAHLRWSTAAVMLAALTSSGCETTVESSDGRPLPPRPTPAQPLPEGAKANKLAVMMVGPKPIDTNGNGWLDLIQLEAYLFCEPYAAPMFERGSFHFALYPFGQSSAGVEPVAQWDIPAETAETLCRDCPPVGRCYWIGLSLLDGGFDGRAGAAGDLVGRFEPSDGRGVLPLIGARTIQLAGAGVGGS